MLKLSSRVRSFSKAVHPEYRISRVRRLTVLVYMQRKSRSAISCRNRPQARSLLAYDGLFWTSQTASSTMLKSQSRSSRHHCCKRCKIRPQVGQLLTVHFPMCMCAYLGRAPELTESQRRHTESTSRPSPQTRCKLEFQKRVTLVSLKRCPLTACKALLLPCSRMLPLMRLHSRSRRILLPPNTCLHQQVSNFSMSTNVLQLNHRAGCLAPQSVCMPSGLGGL